MNKDFQTISKLDFSDARHDTAMHLSATIATTTLRELLQRGSSRLVDFPRPDNAAYLHETEERVAYWPGVADVPQLWNSLNKLDRVVTTSVAAPDHVSASQLLHAVHFCAVASQL